MLKLRYLLLAAVAGTIGTAAPAGVVGQDVAACRAGKPAVIVRVAGLKKPSGKLKIGVYPADSFLQKRGTVSKDTIAVRSSGPIDVCLSVPRPGRYAVAVHHDLNGNGDRDLSDGGGYSNNPRLSLTNLKPSFKATAVQIGNAPKRVGVVLQYRRGLSIGPVQG